MADYHRVIEFLRDLRQGAGGVPHAVTDEISHMAAEYATLCTQANERLRQCSAFLQDGLRSEAIHLAEQTPNLLDLVAQLDLPDPQAWAEFCESNGLPVPPALQLERAAQLNEAYAQEQPMEHLLARHRLLALSRAPVRQRLEIMRRIIQMDPTGAHWEKDIRTFEQARLKELPSAFYSAMKNHDQLAIENLHVELSQEQWYENPPVDLLSAVNDAHARIQRADLEAQLRKLVEPLRDAYAARSLQECQALVTRWKNMMAAVNVAVVAPDLMDEIRPVVAFITEETRREEHLRRFNESCKAFVKLLDAEASDSQLEAGYARLKEFHEEIPEEIARRYMNKKTARRKDVERRHKQRLAVIGGVFATVILIGLAVLFMFMHASTAGKWAARIHDAVARHTRAGLEEAQGDVDKLRAENPGLLKEPKVAAAVNELAVQKSRYETDSASLQSLLTRLETARQAAAAVVGRENAGINEISAVATALDAVASESNALAEGLGWADPDGRLKAAQAATGSTLAALQARVGVTARAEIEAVNTRMATVPTDPGTPELASAAQRDLAALADRVKVLQALPLLDQVTRKDVQALAQQLAVRRLGAATSNDVATGLASIRSHTVSAQDLKGALEAFVAAFPDDARTADFRAALKKIPAAQSLEEWEALLATYREDGLVPRSFADARKRFDAVNAFIGSNGANPRAEDAGQYATYLQNAQDAMSDKGPWQSAFADITTNWIYSDLDVMEVSDGRRYYTHGDVKRTERRLMNQVSVSFEAVDARDVTRRIEVTINPPASVVGPTPAPHTRLVAEIADGLKVIGPNNWDTFGIDVADRAARNEQIDVVVKAIIVQAALKAEQQVAGGPLGVGTTYEKIIDDLSRQTPDQQPWTDPSKVTEGTRRAIKVAIEGMPSSASVKEKMAAARTAMFKSMVMEGLTPGVLLKDDKGQWTISTRATALKGTVVWGIREASGSQVDKQSVLVPVGTVAGNNFVLDEENLRSVPQGSIVYTAR